MRSVIPVGLALVTLVASGGCGRIGYDQRSDDVDAAIDADPIDWQAATCGTPVMLIDHGAAEGGPYGIDVTPTTTGFVIIWTINSTYVKSAAVAVDGGGTQIGVINSGAVVVEAASAAFATAALDDDVLVGVDNEISGRVDLYALDAYGYERAQMKAIDTARAYGHAFVSANPVRDVFLVSTAESGGIAAHTRDRDAHPYSGPDQVFAESVTEGAGGVTATGGNGYLMFTGNGSHCLLTPVDAAMMPVAAQQEEAMTCHHASAIVPPGSNNVIAAWNCDNDAVWTTAGDPTTPLPAYSAVYGDSAMSASNPRLAPAPGGAWYAYQVAGGILGATLMDVDGQVVTGAEPHDVYQSNDLVAYDLAARPDGAFLFWIEAATDDTIWAMRLCPP